MAELRDGFARKIDYLRLSVTDRCNMRCTYCMPPEGVQWREREEILTYEELLTFAEAALKAGISRIRLTGGEPLVRKDIVRLVHDVSSLEGLTDLSLTTNGTLLAGYAQKLKDAGLHRVNISIDSLDEKVYARITRGAKLRDALAGLDAALAVGFEPVKVNVVLLKGVNDDVSKFVEMTKEKPVHVRFIEQMDLDAEDEGGLTCPQIEAIISELGETEETEKPFGGGPARYVRLKGAKGTLGFICPTSGHLCSACNRLRLTPDGRLRTCLFGGPETPVREAMRSGISVDGLVDIIKDALKNKPERKEIGSQQVKRMMSQIGG